MKKGKALVVIVVFILLFICICSITCIFTGGDKASNQIDDSDLSFIYVEDYGAVGNGEVDDTAAFRSAMQQSGVIRLNPTKIYLISDSIIVDLDRIKGIQGNGAKIKLTTNVPAFILQGNKIEGAATPSLNQKIKHEISPYIDGVHVYSDNYVGTGFQLDGTFGVIFTKNHLYGLEKGIELVNRNRNVNISHNNLWDIAKYGIHYNNTNTHQNIINNNHISYMQNALFFENGDVHNVQIVGNDIELGESPNKDAESVIKVRTEKMNTQFSQVQIVGNSIEDHFLSSSGLINMYSELYKMDELVNEKPPYIGMIEIVGNEVSGATQALIVENVNDLTVNGNTFKLVSDTFITINTSGKGFNITGNTFSGRPGNNYGGTLLKVIGAKEGFDTSVQNLVFSSNIGYDLTDNPVKIRRRAGISEVFDTNEINISNNVFSSADEKSDNTLLEGFMLEFVPTTMHGINITNNTFKGVGFNEHGMWVSASILNNIVIKNNIIRGLVAREGVQPNIYEVPEGNGTTIIVSENIPLY